MDDIVERLRHAASGGKYPRALATEAADKIEQLQKIIDAAKDARDWNESQERARDAGL